MPPLLPAPKPLRLRAPWATALATAAALLLAAPHARAQTDTPPCWAATVSEPISPDGLPIGHPGFAPLNRALDVLEQLARRNAGLAQLPEVRLRAQRVVGDAELPSQQPRDATLHVKGFGPKAWGRGACEVIPQADRLGGRVGISFFINNPLATLQRWAHDDQLTAYLEGERSEPMHGWPVYGGCAVLTAERRVWWKPVTVGDWLAFQAREQLRRIDEHDRSHARQLEPFDLAAAEAHAESIRPLDEKAAALALHVARDRKRREPAWHASIHARRAALQAEHTAVVAHRASLSPAALAEPFRLGNGRFRLPTESERSLPLKRLVQLDPGFGWDGQRRTRVQAIQVCPSLLDRNPSYGPPMREAVRDLDFARIAALLN